MTWLQAAYALLQVILEAFRLKRSADDRQAGADSANASTRAQNDARVKEANEAEIEADKRHKAMPGDEAFDTEFRRD